MKKLSKNLKYIAFGFVLIIASFVFAKSASAYTYSYNCSAASGGGVITSEVFMGPPYSPFSESNATLFQVSGEISSTCTSRNVALTAKNNSGTEFPIVPFQMLAQWGTTTTYIDTINFTSPNVAGSSYAVNYKTTVEEPNIPPPPIGHVFAVGPWFHGTHSMAAYEGDPIHPPLTVRVKRFGRQVPYSNTTNPEPNNSEDCILNIPQGYANTPMPQMSSNWCSIGLEGANYGTVTSVTGGNVGILIPYTYHICRYNDAPSSGMYFTPSTYNGVSGIYRRTCPTEYPDADVVY